MSNRVCKEDQIKLIMECCRSGYTFSESKSKENAVPNIQEVVKLDLVPESEPIHTQMIEQTKRQFPLHVLWKTL